ncbi:MerR family transcriptional regulator [Bacillus sp. S/N-304-OC-R1]|uniref:MerR family transcriptional regulator n=1 Tax=Bacillus sp. S/N-304-OC-R1 TaxID=2758034 RepID=UPI001C8EEFDD|nr:MerR family transcriptional regulator [Bacillus sp. S/N-304-OC-R1]MBY0123687.1 MerR family transcriptional regulator [Bacillus sp. S/N-304-OC-R1]
MEYTVQGLAKLAGVSTRTLRYYDEIGILKPARVNSSGYRIYGKAEVDRLQQILFYRELDVSLDNIKKIVTSPSFDKTEALKEHREKLLEKRNQLDLLITNVEKSIEQTEGRIIMSDQEKFTGFKKKMIEDNEAKYGKEIREKYGDDKVEQSNAKLMNMSEEDYKKVTNLANQITETLAAAFATGDPSGELAQNAADLHKQWLCYYWKEYSKEAHAGLAQMYVDDERFTAYYDKDQPGTAEFLRDAILIYTGMTSN